MGVPMGDTVQYAMLGAIVADAADMLAVMRVLAANMRAHKAVTSFDASVDGATSPRFAYKTLVEKGRLRFGYEALFGADAEKGDLGLTDDILGVRLLRIGGLWALLLDGSRTGVDPRRALDILLSSLPAGDYGVAVLSGDDRDGYREISCSCGKLREEGLSFELVDGPSASMASFDALQRYARSHARRKLGGIEDRAELALALCCSEWNPYGAGEAPAGFSPEETRLRALPVIPASLDRNRWGVFYKQQGDTVITEFVAPLRRAPSMPAHIIEPVPASPSTRFEGFSGAPFRGPRDPWESRRPESEGVCGREGLFESAVIAMLSQFPFVCEVTGQRYLGRMGNIEALVPGSPVVLRADWQSRFFSPCGIEVFDLKGRSLANLGGYHNPRDDERAAIACLLPHIRAYAESVRPVGAALGPVAAGDEFTLRLELEPDLDLSALMEEVDALLALPVERRALSSIVREGC